MARWAPTRGDGLPTAERGLRLRVLGRRDGSAPRGAGRRSSAGRERQPGGPFRSAHRHPRRVRAVRHRRLGPDRHPPGTNPTCRATGSATAADCSPSRRCASSGRTSASNPPNEPSLGAMRSARPAISLRSAIRSASSSRSTWWCSRARTQHRLDGEGYYPSGSPSSSARSRCVPRRKYPTGSRWQRSSRSVSAPM